MTTGIKVTLQPNGDLLFQANNETRAELAARFRENWRNAEGDILEMIRGQYTATINGKPFHYALEWLDPGDIFAMTDMPLFADNVRDDDDATRVYGPVWGFPDYMIRDYIAELAHTGRTTMTMVANYGEGMTFPSRYSEKALAEKVASEAYVHLLDGEPVIERVADIHGEEGDTIAKLVGFRTRSPEPAVGDLFA